MGRIVPRPDLLDAGVPAGIRDGALEVLRRLRSAGHVALLAGGGIRDLLLGRTPKDLDVATSATPDEVRALFPRVIEVGAAFGVLRVLVGGETYEVATFRTEGGYRDGRHPDRVSFSGPEEDARRRDFTINALFYDPADGGIRDHVGGLADLEARVLRAIGDPEERFQEDHLRMLRAVRFAVRLGFEVDPGTRAAIRRLAPNLRRVSRERIRDEFLAILVHPRRVAGIRSLLDLALMESIIPEVLALQGVPQPEEFHPEGDVLTHTLLLLGFLDAPSPELALAGLLHDIAKPCTMERLDRIRFHGHAEVGADMARRIAEGLRLSRRSTDLVEVLVRWHLRFAEVKRMREGKLRRFLRDPRIEDHLALHRADCLASHGKLDLWEFCRERLAGLAEEDLRPAPLLGGRDLIEAGWTPGPGFGRMLREVETEQLEGRLQDREQALAFLRHRHPPPREPDPGGGDPIPPGLDPPSGDGEDAGQRPRGQEDPEEGEGSPPGA